MRQHVIINTEAELEGLHMNIIKKVAKSFAIENHDYEEGSIR